MITYHNLLIITHIILINSTSMNREIFYKEKDVGLETIASCTRLVANRLFSPRTRTALIRNNYNNVESAIVKHLMETEMITIVDYPMKMKNRRIPSYIMVEPEKFMKSREMLLSKVYNLHNLEYLFVVLTDANKVSAFVGDLWEVGFRDIAFLMFNNVKNGTIIRPTVTSKGIILRTLGYCTSLRNNVDRIPSFSSSLYRFCSRKSCGLKYGKVEDDNVRFWKMEDRMKVTENLSYVDIGEMLIKRFGNYYNIDVITKVESNYSWKEMPGKLVNEDIDIVSGLMPDRSDTLDGLEIICWYMFRGLVFAGRIKLRSFGNDILKLLMPFHYMVWLYAVCLLIVYVLLVSILRKLSFMGLIRERLEFMHICSIILSQSVTYPTNFGLRLVLLLWMIFTLYFNIAYDSTFTSSLAQLETEVLLKDLKELRDSGKPVGGPNIIRSYLNGSLDEVVKDVYERYISMTPQEAYDAIMNNDTIAVMQHFTVNRINWETRDDRSVRIYSLSDPVMYFPLFFFARKEHPYRNALRRFVISCREIGLMKKWTTTNVIDEDKQIALGQSSDEILTIKHLRVIFELFFIGQGISCMIFFIELLRGYIARRSK